MPAGHGEYATALDSLLSGLRHLRSSHEAPASSRLTKGYFFLSYAEEDSNFVASLRSFLAERGYAYWDYQDSDSDYHRDLYLELEGIIREAAGTFSILSPSWKRSRTAIQEYHFSIEVGTPVFLLKALPMEPTLIVAGIRHIDFTHDPASAFKRLERELARKKL